MWIVIAKMVGVEAAKILITALVKKLLDAKGDGITKELAEAMLNGIAQSKHNNAPQDAIDAVKAML